MPYTQFYIFLGGLAGVRICVMSAPNLIGRLAQAVSFSLMFGRWQKNGTY